MDIRTKLIFALVAVSLGSMFVLGAVVSPRVEGYIRDGTVRQLDQLADARMESLGWIIAGWRDGTALVASRTQLRASLDERARVGTAASIDRIPTILDDALGASRSALLLQVHDIEGRPVASVQRPGSTPLPALPPAPAPTSYDATTYLGVTVRNAGPPQVTFVTPMLWQERLVGTLVAVFEAPELLELADNYRGLGETGETMVVAEIADGEVVPLHPLRHAPGAQDASGTDLARRALAGQASLLVEGAVDYRGAPVWAATRTVDETGWGVIVKIDRAEAMSSISDFEDWLRRTALILSAFAIVLGLVLALRFALPIHALAEVADRIRHGEMDARADTAREDEVGLLARTFNEMADELESRMKQLTEFRRFFEVTIDLMCIAGLDGFFRKTNPAFERELGWSEEELRERPFLDFVHPDDVQKTEAEVAKLAGGIPTISFQNRYECKDGSYKLLRWTSYPKGDVLYAIARVVDGSRTHA